jgi:hypothetical protein
MRRAAGALAAAEAILRDELADVSGALDAALKVRLLYIYMYKYTYIHTYIEVLKLASTDVCAAEAR